MCVYVCACARVCCYGVHYPQALCTDTLCTDTLACLAQALCTDTLAVLPALLPVPAGLGNSSDDELDTADWNLFSDVGGTPVLKRKSFAKGHRRTFSSGNSTPIAVQSEPIKHFFGAPTPCLYYAFVFGASALTLGYDLGIIAIAKFRMQRDLELTDLQVDTLVGSLNIVSAFGALASGWLSDSLGRCPCAGSLPLHDMFFGCACPTYGCQWAARCLLVGHDTAFGVVV